MKKKGVKFSVTVVLIIVSMMLSYIYPLANVIAIEDSVNNDISAQAEGSQVVNNVITVNSEEELRNYSLLGTTSEQALEEYPGLGLAKYFSLFCEDDATFTGADTEGRVAVGGKITGNATKYNTLYEYQIGCENSDEYSADIIVGNGPVENIALDYGYTDDGYQRTEDNKIVAYANNNMDLSKYTEDQKKHFVKADLIDFNSEFARLRKYSQELANQKETEEKLSGNYYAVGNAGENQERIPRSNA